MLKTGLKYLLYQIYEEGYVMTSTQRVWRTNLSFYLSISSLKRLGLVKEEMVDGRTKKWVLTKAGRKVVEIHKKFDELEKELDVVLENAKET